MNVTINDIASIAGVSKATVSRVLSGSPEVSTKTRARVERLIRDVGYEPSYLARGLSRRRTNMIGVVVDELANEFFMQIAAAVEHVIRAEGYTMMLSTSNWAAEQELDIVREMIRHRPAAVILAPVSVDSPAIDALKRHEIPFVLLNCRSDDPEVRSVSADSKAGGMLAARFIGSRAFEQIVLVTGFEHQTLQDRVEGFLDGLETFAGAEVARSVARVPGVCTWEDGYRAASELVARHRLLDADSCVFVTNDNVAIGLIEGLIDLGIDVPGQVSVMGYDDIRYAQRYRVPLTTIRQPEEAMGTIAAQELVSRIGEPDREPNSYLLPVKLVVRESVRPAKTAGDDRHTGGRNDVSP